MHVKVWIIIICMEVNLAISTKVTNAYVFDLAILLLNAYPYLCSHMQSDLCIMLLIVTLFVTARDWRQPKWSSIMELSNYGASIWWNTKYLFLKKRKEWVKSLLYIDSEESLRCLVSGKKQVSVEWVYYITI